jgi:hypothetical protein
VKSTVKTAVKVAMKRKYGELVNVVDVVIFLGLKHSINKKGLITSTLTPKNKKLLSFLSKEMANAMKICDTNSINMHAESKLFKKASESVASFVESRIQYGIMFADLNTIYFFYNIHKKMISSLLGFPARKFGFKWRTESEGKHVNDLYDTLNGICSNTYLTLCSCAGKPSLLGMAFRQALVIEKQFLNRGDTTLDTTSTRLRRRKPPFEQKIDKFIEKYTNYCTQQSHDKPKATLGFGLFKEFKLRSERKVYIKLLTDIYFTKHLTLRGKPDATSSCHCGHESDTLGHLVESHINISSLSNKSITRSINKYVKMENKMIQDQSRVKLEMDPLVCSTITKLILRTDENIGHIPSIQIC